MQTPGETTLRLTVMAGATFRAVYLRLIKLPGPYRTRMAAGEPPPRMKARPGPILVDESPRINRIDIAIFDTAALLGPCHTLRAGRRERELGGGWPRWELHPTFDRVATDRTQSA